jgi:hypothetical protein
MSHLCIETRGIASWRERLADPETQWRRKYSAFETAVSWEGASCSDAGLPQPIADLFRNSIFGQPTLLLSVAEHKVPLKGRGGDSQCDVWALVQTANAGIVSLSVEAKAKEPFGSGNESLGDWLDVNLSKQFPKSDPEVQERIESSRKNRRERWAQIEQNLPRSENVGYLQVPYQLLHRCATAVIEAKRFRISSAVFIVQAFKSPSESQSSLENFSAFSSFCDALGVKAEHGRMQITTVERVQLGIGWADCPFATDEQVAAVV